VFLLQVTPCLSISMDGTIKGQVADWKFSDDAQQHFEELFRQTRIFRDIPIHKTSDYSGPWLVSVLKYIYLLANVLFINRIENHFITQFSRKKLEEFNGFIPLFVQWVDIHVYSLEFENKPERNNSIPHHKDMPMHFRKVCFCVHRRHISLSFRTYSVVAERRSILDSEPR
jgi:hypothetical protein